MLPNCWLLSLLQEIVFPKHSNTFVNAGLLLSLIWTESCVGKSSCWPAASGTNTVTSRLQHSSQTGFLAIGTGKWSWNVYLTFLLLRSSTALPFLPALCSTLFSKVLFMEEAEVASCHLKMSVGFQNELFDFAYMSWWRGFCPLLTNYCWIILC